MADAGALEPLGNDLPPETRALASELRTLFAGLNMSMSRYASRVFRDKSVVSRYLSGDRIPDWRFVNELLVESTRKRNNNPPTVEIVGHLKKLHRTALEANSSPHSQIMLLQEELRAADAAAERAQKRESQIEVELQAAEQRVAQLIVDLRELEYTVDYQQRQHAAIVTQQQNQFDDEQQILLSEIARLERDLDEAREQRFTAEARADHLEHQLEMAESEYDSQDPAAAVQNFSRLVAQSLNVMSSTEAATTMDQMPAEWAVAVFKNMQSEKATAALDKMQPQQLAAMLNRMNLQQATSVVNHMKPAQATAALSRMDREQATDVLNIMNPELVAKVLKIASLSQAIAMADQMSRNRAHVALRGMDVDRSSAVLSGMNKSRAAAVLKRMNIELAAALLERLPPAHAAVVLQRMNTERTTAIRDQLGAAKFDDVLRRAQQVERPRRNPHGGSEGSATEAQDPSSDM